MFKTSRENLQRIMLELDQAVHNHNNWYKNLIRSIVCQLPHDTRDMADDAYKHCPFGQWYYTSFQNMLPENTSLQSIETEHRKMHEIATDLLMKSSNNEPISPYEYDAFANIVERLRINIELLKHEIEEVLYRRDPLTGAQNRISMMGDLRRQMELVKRNVQKSVIVLMDIDHFKTVNDTYGHLVGDSVLSSLANYILEHIRPYDKLYRFGGEEFLISLPNTDLETADMIIERLREGIAGLIAARYEDEPVQVTASFGLSMLVADIDVEKAIEQADQALYHAKQNGRNCIMIWDRSQMGVP